MFAGNSGFSWSDVLLGDLPNVYVYAANNPSESIIAKRRGYGTIVSHNVPPYGRWVAQPIHPSVHPVNLDVLYLRYHSCYSLPLSSAQSVPVFLK